MCTKLALSDTVFQNGWSELNTQRLEYYSIPLPCIYNIDAILIVVVVAKHF